MHKEEFYSLLLEDNFISYLIKETKQRANDLKKEEIINKINILEYDFKNFKTEYNFPNDENNCKNKKDFSNIIHVNTPVREMTRFSLFLHHQLVFRIQSINF